MKEFVLLYFGKKMKPGLDPKKSMQDWKTWIQGLGDKIVNPGTPFGKSFEVDAKKAFEIPSDQWPATGMTIIKAKDMDEAVEIAKTCPTLSHQEDGIVRVYEQVEMKW